MKMNYYIENGILLDHLEQAEKDLFAAERIKFKKDKLWRESLPAKPGIYALYEGNHTLLYIGETGNLRERMNEINRTVNHTFRKELGHKRFGGTKSKKKFEPEVELKLDEFFTDTLHVAYLIVNYGRLEIETSIITNNQSQLLNSEKKRKLKMEIELIEEKD